MTQETLKRLTSQIQHLEAHYKIGDEVYMQNSCKRKLSLAYLRPFVVRKVFESHDYIVEDAVGNQKRLHLD